MEAIEAIYTAYSEMSVEALTEVLLINIRVMLLLSACLTLPRLFSHSKSSAANHHIIIAIGFLSTLILPFSSKLMPSYDVVFEVTRPVISSELPEAISKVFRESTSSNEQLISLSSIILFAYLCIVAFALWHIIYGNIKVSKLSTCCKPVLQRYWTANLQRHRKHLGISRPVVIKHSHLIKSPMTWGFNKPVILIPDQALHWPDQLINSTLLHELAHIKRCDWLTHQLSRCICALYWINPLCWKALGSLHIYAEKASDDIVLLSGHENASYANNLVDVATHLNKQHWQTAAALGLVNGKKPSQLRQRVQALLCPGEQHAPLTIAQVIVALAIILLVLLPASSFRASFVEKVNFVVSYPREEQEPEAFEEKLTHNEGSVETQEATPTLVALKDLLKDNERPNQEEIARALPALSMNVVKTELNPLSANEIVSRAKQKITESLDVENDDSPENHYVNPETDEPEARQSPIEVSTPAPPYHDSHRKKEAIIENHFATKMVMPTYPRRAQVRGIEGEVTIEYSLDAHGRVIDARVVSAIPEKVFNRSVLRAIKKSEFVPRKINGEAVSSRGLTEKYVFVLES